MTLYGKQMTVRELIDKLHEFGEANGYDMLIWKGTREEHEEVDRAEVMQPNGRGEMTVVID